MNDLDKKAFFYFLLAYWSWKKDKKSVFPEMLYVFDIESIVKFVKVFGGKSFTVPTWEDLSLDLKEAISAYLHHSEGCTHDYIQKFLEIDGRKYAKMRNSIDSWEEYIQNSRTQQ